MRRARAGYALLLVAATCLAYAPVRENEFVRFDDPLYVTENPHVAPGWTAEGVAWAFTTGHAANWHPLTWLSHMSDCDLWGLDPAGHHLTSVLLHAANAVLLFLLLCRMSGAAGPSAFVAGVFALHPLHVESVAWVAERKDVLSTLLGLLSLLVWSTWVERRGPARYLLALALYALSLMAKPMLVSLPIVMLLLDRWPLGRWPLGRIPAATAGDRRGAILKLLREKVPFFVLAGVSCAVTFAVQRSGGSMDRLGEVPLSLRAGNALVSYVAYLVKAIWPADLAVFYPYPVDGLSAWKVGGAGLALWAATVLFLRAGVARPYLAVGWAWYLVTLLPVIGLVHVGRQSMADRYTYVPLVGPSILVAWGARDLSAKWARGPALRLAAGFAFLAVCFLVTRAQVGTWRDDVALFGHARSVTAGNHLAQYALAGALRRRGNLEEAVAAYREAQRIDPDFVDTRIEFGALLEELGDLDGAAEQFQAALDLDPVHAGARSALQRVLEKRR